MKRWENVNRIKVGLDFGSRKTSVRMGDAAIAEGRVYLQFGETFASKNINPSPIRLRLDDSLQQGTRDLEGLPGLLHDSLPDGWSRLILDRALR